MSSEDAKPLGAEEIVYRLKAAARGAMSGAEWEAFDAVVRDVRATLAARDADNDALSKRFIAKCQAFDALVTERDEYARLLAESQAMLLGVCDQRDELRARCEMVARTRDEMQDAALGAHRLIRVAQDNADANEQRAVAAEARAAKLSAHVLALSEYTIAHEKPNIRYCRACAVPVVVCDAESIHCPGKDARAALAETTEAGETGPR